MNNYRTLAETYYDTFYATKNNINLFDKRTLFLILSIPMFIYSSVVFFTNAIGFDFLFSSYIGELVESTVAKNNKNVALTIIMLFLESIMIFASWLFQKKKAKLIKQKLHIKLSLSPDMKMDSFKQKWLCKTFSCFPHELAIKANDIYRQLEISNQIKRIESFSLQIFMDMIYSKDSKPRVIGLFIAFVSLSIALFISKSNNLKIEYLFSLLTPGSFFSILMVSLALLGIFWFLISMLLFIREFFTSKSDKTKLLISDMITLNEIKIVEV